MTGPRPEPASPLRYADGPRATAVAHVTASLASVWTLVSDPAFLASVSSELQHASWLDGANGPALGARFPGVNDHPIIGRSSPRGPRPRRTSAGQRRRAPPAGAPWPPGRLDRDPAPGGAQ